MDNAALDELERVARVHMDHPNHQVGWHDFKLTFDPPTILALITAARRPALPDREAVARVIDPEAFKANTYVYDMYPIRRVDALTKADDIIAPFALSAAPKEGE